MQEQSINELGLYDIYVTWHVPFWHTFPFYMFISSIFLIFIVAIGWYFYKKYKLRKKFVSSWESALSQIDYLQKNNYANIERSKEFYCALTSILKRYMHERYGFDTREKTDQEFLRYLEEQGFSTLFIQDFIAIFEGSATIKFANTLAAQQQIDHDLAAAISFIKKTIPVKVE